MKRSVKRKLFFISIIIVLIIAALLDIKYQGLFYQLLPDSIQAYLTERF